MNYGVFPAEFALEPLERPDDISAARQLAVLAQQQVRNSSYIYRGGGGNYDLYTNETVSSAEHEDAPETVLEVVRPAWDVNRYVTLENGDLETSVTIDTTIRTVRLEGGHAGRLHALKNAVHLGRLAGEMSVQAHRFREAQLGGGFSSLILQTTVSTGHNEGQPPINTVDLLLSRGFGPEGNRTFNQQYRIVHDTGADMYLAGSDAVAANGDERGIIALVNWGDWLQKCSDPRLPVNRMLTPDDWLQVVTEPLVLKDMVHLNGRHNP